MKIQSDLCFYTEHELEIINRVQILIKEIKQRPFVAEYRKGQCLIIQGKGFQVLKVNKKSLSLYAIGMGAPERPKEDRTTKYATRQERKMNYSLDTLNGVREITRAEAAVLLYDTLLEMREEKRQKAADKACVVGSRKYNQLKYGNAWPRVGDFLKSKTTGITGFMLQDGVFVGKQYGMIIDVNGVETFLAKEDCEWLAPYEWEQA